MTIEILMMDGHKTILHSPKSIMFTDSRLIVTHYDDKQFIFDVADLAYAEVK